MKLLFYVLLVTVLTICCKTNNKQELDNPSSEKQTGISQPEMYEELKMMDSLLN